jgi:hypothetical protein
LKMMVDKKLMFEESDRYLSLAVPVNPWRWQARMLRRTIWRCQSRCCSRRAELWPPARRPTARRVIFKILIPTCM